MSYEQLSPANVMSISHTIKHQSKVANAIALTAASINWRADRSAMSWVITESM